MNGEKKRTSISAVVALLTFCVFVVLIVMVILTGATSYKRLVERSESVYDWRTVDQYLSTKIRQSDEVGAVWVDEFSDQYPIDTLFLSEETDGQRYMTRIYCCDGYLYELYADSHTDLAPEDGEKIAPVEQLVFEKQGNCIAVQIDCIDGREIKQTFGLRAGREYRNEQ